MSALNELIKEIEETRNGQTSVSNKDEIRIMRTMLNDPDFSVDMYNKTGVIGQYCPFEDSHNMVANIIKNTTHINAKEAESLASNYEFTNKDATTFINVSKEFVNTYMETGRKLPLGGRADSDIALSKKVKKETPNKYIKKVGVDNDGNDIYETVENGVIPAHGSLKVHSSCPAWLKK